MGNGTRVHHNNFYDNGTAVTTDSFFAGGHPGYPQDGAVFENNKIYSNNFNSYVAGSDVEPRVPVPVGVGIMIAGGNGNEIRNNRIWDNWRRGTMLLHVPDSLSDETKTTSNSVSHRNRYHDNIMGIAPNGDRVPNGVDFWWDEAPAQEDNCWFDNGSVTTDPAAPVLPSNCENTSDGAGYTPKLTGELAPCAGAIGGSGGYDPDTCSWFRTPPKPSVAAAGGGAAGAVHRSGVGHDARGPGQGRLSAQRHLALLQPLPRQAVRRAGVLCAVVLAAGCGTDAPAPKGGPLGPGARLQTATCGHWTKASEGQRSEHGRPP